MKLIIAVVNKDDSNSVVQKLNKAGFMCTKLSTTGGFLRSGNTTLLIGTEQEKVDEVIEILGKCCSKRSSLINASAVTGSEQYFPGVPVEIAVGGATVFVLDVEKFIKM